MLELTQEQYDQLPEFMQGEYEKLGEVYKHKGVVKLKGTLNDLNSKLETSKTELGAMHTVQEQAIQQAREEAYSKAVSENNLEGVQKTLNEKIEDANRRADETASTFKARLERLAVREETAIAAQLSTMATDKGKAAFLRLVQSMIKVDAEADDNAVTFYNVDGSATTLDKAGFIDYIKKSPLFATLVKADITTNGDGMTEENNGGSATKKPEEYTEKERIELFRSDPVLFNKLFKK